jgi:hypothetical protein
MQAHDLSLGKRVFKPLFKAETLCFVLLECIRIILNVGSKEQTVAEPRFLKVTV